MFLVSSWAVSELDGELQSLIHVTFAAGLHLLYSIFSTGLFIYERL